MSARRTRDGVVFGVRNGGGRVSEGAPVALGPGATFVVSMDAGGALAATRVRVAGRDAVSALGSYAVAKPYRLDERIAEELPARTGVCAGLVRRAGIVSRLS